MFVITVPATPRQNRIFKRQERARRKRLVKLAGSNYANLSDDELDKLLDNGYEQARDEFGRRKVREFLAKHPEVSKEIGGFPIVLTYKFGTFHLHLEIPLWGVSLRSLRDAEGALGRLRKALRPYQLHGVVSDIVAWKKDGRSNDQIAQELNELVADHLKQYRVYEFQIRCDKDKTQEEICDLKRRMEEDMHYVRHVFYWMGFSEAEVAKIVADAFKVISVEMRKCPPSLPALTVDEVVEPIDEDDLEELPPGWDECLSISFKKGWDETNEFVRMTQATRRKHRKGPPYRYPITAERVRARLRSLGLA